MFEQELLTYLIKFVALLAIAVAGAFFGVKHKKKKLNQDQIESEK